MARLKVFLNLYGIVSIILFGGLFSLPGYVTILGFEPIVTHADEMCKRLRAQ